MELIISILAGIVIIEVYTWLPNFSKWLLERAVCRVRAEDRKRCRREWNADLDALPNTLVKLWFALSNFSSSTADRINADFIEAKCDEIDDALEEFVSRYRVNFEKLRKIKIQLSRSKRNIEKTLEDALSSIKAPNQSRGSPNEQPSASYQNCVCAFEGFSQTLIRAIDRHRDLLDVSVNCASARLDHIDSVLKMVSSKRDRLTELAQQKNLSSDALAPLLESITDDFGVLRTLDSDDWDDDPAAKEREKIMAAIEGVCNEFGGH